MRRRANGREESNGRASAADDSAVGAPTAGRIDDAGVGGAGDVPGDEDPADGADVESAIRGAARRILVEEGIDALSMRAVASRVGVSATAIYHYFENKGELVDEVVGRAFGHIESYLRQRVEGRPRGSPERLRALLAGYIRFALEHEQCFRVLFALRGECLREMRDHPAEGCERLLHETVRDAMAAGTLAGDDAEAVSLYLWSSVHGLVTLSLACKLEVPQGGPAVGALELFERSWEMILDGLRPRPASAGEGDGRAGREETLDGSFVGGESRQS